MLSKGLPTSWYVDKAHGEAEIAKVLTPGWHYVGTTTGLGMDGAGRRQIPIMVGKVSALIVVDGADTRAFLNVCRHRSSQLVDAVCDKAAITCPYHGWTYNLSGQLVSAPRIKNELDSELPVISLHELEMRIWHNLVFLSIASSPTAPAEFDEWIGPVEDGLVSLGVDIDALTFHSRSTSQCTADWKVVVENYLECYHCQIAHPELSATIDVRPESYVLQTASHVASQYAVSKAGRSDKAPAGAPDSGFWFVWPNLVINVLPGIANLSIGPIYSAGAGRSYRFLDYLFAPHEDAQAIADLLAWDDQVGVEDVALVERVQCGLSSASRAGHTQEPMQLMPQSEQLIAWFAEHLRNAVQGE